jgi:hypothetical protein
MNWDAIGAIGELLGSLILIATVFYLSLQIRSTADHASASSERGVQQDFIDIQDSLLVDERTIQTMRKGYSSFASLNDQEKYFFHMKTSLFVNHLEGVLRMNAKGLISDDMVRDHGNVVLTILGSPGGREFWNVAGSTFLERSAAYINEHLESGADWGTMTHLFPYFFEHENSET